MPNISSLEKLKKLSFETTSLAIAVMAFTLSSLYVNNGFLRVTFVLQQTAVFAIFGFLHAYNVWELDNVINKQKQSIFMLFCYFLVYTAWYNVVLLPKSGLGLIEWVIVLIVLASNFITELTSKKIYNPFMGQRPIVLVIFGVILFIVKMLIFYTTNGDNVYDSLILGNSAARTLVGIFSILGLFLLLSQLYKHITNKFEIKTNKNKTDNSLSFIKKVIKVLLIIFSLPVILPIILFSSPLILLWISDFYTAVVKFVETNLEMFTSTGENTLYPSNLYYTCQIISMATVLFYTVYIEKIMRLTIEKDIEKQIRLEVDKLETNDSEQLFYETKQLLLDNRFNEQLRIFGNTTIVKKTVHEKTNNN